MINCSQNFKRGYTIVELMVTIVIVACLTGVIGYFVVKMMRLQELEREEAYVREKLVEICGNYADAISVGSYFTLSNGFPVVSYRMEAGGVSLETGTVTRVARLASFLDVDNGTVALDVQGYIGCEFKTNKLSRTANGSALLLPLVSKLINIKITPLDDDNLESAIFGNLQVAAEYEIEDENGEFVKKPVAVERIVRLWNRE